MLIYGLGGKNALIDAIKRQDMDFVTVFNKSLPPAQQHFVRIKMGPAILASENELIAEVSKINGFVVTKSIIRQLQLESPLEEDLMTAVLKLFEKRDNRISEAHASVNELSNGYEVYKKSFFLPSPCVRSILQNTSTAHEVQRIFFNDRHLDANVSKLYFIDRPPDSDTAWVLYIVDVEEKHVLYLDPRRQFAHPLSAALQMHLNHIQPIFSAFLHILIPAFTGNWSCKLMQEYYFSPPQNEYDYGLYITATIFFCCNNVPVFFGPASITQLRMTLAYWLLIEDLPC